MISSDIPARLDRLPWSRWHWRVVIALGVAWVLDGLEVTLVGSIGGVLERGDTLALTAAQIGWTGSLYVGGAVIGALVFGRLTDRLGRKRLFIVTLAVYTLATLATAFSPTSRSSRCAVSSPAWASAANTRRSIRRSTS